MKFVFYKKKGDGFIRYKIGFLFSDSENYNMLINPYNDRIEFRSFSKREYEIVNYSEELKQKLIEDVTTQTDAEVSLLEATYKSENRDDYSDEIQKKYDQLKTDIINTCKNVTGDLSEVDLHNKLTAISQKRKQMFEIKCESVRSAEIFNRDTKRKIKKLERNKENFIDSMNLDVFSDVLDRGSYEIYNI